MRKHWLDNLRWATVVLVLLYHVAYLFNGVGVPGGIPGARSLAVCDALMAPVYPWFMVLLFLIAGICARYALERRTAGEFLRERTGKLLVPSTLGLFVVHWVTGYFNIRLGGALEFIPPALVYPISVLSGIGPLWFIQMLFLFSCALVLVKKLDKNDKLWKLGGKATIPVLLLLALPIWGAAQVGNVPVLVMYRFGIYGLAFFLGYFVFSHDEVQETVARIRVPMGVLALAGAVACTVYCFGRDYTAPEILRSLWTNLYLWAVVLAVLGWGRARFDCDTPFTRSMTRCSFGLYVLHYPVLLTVCYVLHTSFTLPAALNYLIALVLEFVLTFALAALVRRLPVVRYLVLGMGNPGNRQRRKNMV